MSPEYPDHLGELSTAAFEDALDELETWIKSIDRNYRAATGGMGTTVSIAGGGGSAGMMPPGGAKGSAGSASGGGGGGGYSFSVPGVPENIFRCIRVIRLVTGMRRQSPWYGLPIDPEDSSVSVGVMMHNAFEAVGDWVEYDGKVNMRDGKRYKDMHWFTRLYLPRWRQGKREYNEWLDSLRELSIADEDPGNKQGHKGQQ